MRTLALIAMLLAGSAASADSGDDATVPVDLTRLNFARVVYDSEGGMGEAYYGYEGRIWARWETDFPQGDQNLNARLGQLTVIPVNRAASKRRLTASDLGDFPLLYMSDPGYMRLSTPEKEALAGYLANGGFLWVDDFWGDAEWQSLERAMRDVLPELRWREIATDHPIFSTVYEIPETPQIPARDFAYPGGGAEQPYMHRYPTGSLETPHLRGWFDADNRLMVVATHNTDIGDGWEREAYGEWYFETYSTKAYALGVNIVVYAMTH